MGDTEAPYFGVKLSINKAVSVKTFDKRYVFKFEIDNFLFLDHDGIRCLSSGIYISHLNSNVSDS